jgi:predicted O-methyltransferase YrrM
MATVDLAYIDGNHRLQPTLNYFAAFLAKSNNNSILIFDDIHWSKEMEEAWETIKQHERVTATIDLFFIGIVLLRNEFKTKQHFKVYF